MVGDIKCVVAQKETWLLCYLEVEMQTHVPVTMHGMD